MNSPNHFSYSHNLFSLPPSTRVGLIVIKHVTLILEETLVEKGYLFYPVCFGQYALILRDQDTVENRELIIRECSEYFSGKGYRVDITDGGFRIYFDN